VGGAFFVGGDAANRRRARRDGLADLVGDRRAYGVQYQRSYSAGESFFGSRCARGVHFRLGVVMP
jgi:hypothetical protein